MVLEEYAARTANPRRMHILPDQPRRAVGVIRVSKPAAETGYAAPDGSAGVLGASALGDGSTSTGTCPVEVTSGRPRLS